MHVDGFRFDLATTLGRVGKRRIHPQAPIFQIIAQDPVLSRVKLIAEPWDVGLGGYQVGNFPAPWREWNGKFRDAHPPLLEGRREPGRPRSATGWRARPICSRATGRQPAGQHQLHHRARRLHAARPGHATAASTTRRTASDNRDGADDNQSWNHGVEGETDDPEIIALRERQKRNLLATLLLSPGRADAARRATRWAAPSAATTTPTARTTSSSWLDWKLDDRAARAAGVHAPADRAAAAGSPILQQRRFFVGDYIWESQAQGPRLAAAGRQRDDAARLAEALASRRWRSRWAATPSRCSTSAAQRLVDDGLLVLMNAAPRADPVQAAGRGGGRAAGCWRSTPPTLDTPREHAVRGRIRGRARARWWCCASRSTPGGTARAGGGRAGPGHQAGGAAPAARGAGRHHPAVLDPGRRPAGGWARSPTCRQFATLGGARRLLGAAAPAGQRGQRRRSQPLRGQLGVRARPRLPVARSLRGLRGRRRPRGAARRARRAHRRPRNDPSRSSTGGAVRALKRAGIALAFERFLRDEWRPAVAARPAPVRVHRAPTASWLDDHALFTVLHAEQRRELARLAGAARAIGIRARSPTARRAHGDELLAGAVGAVAAGPAVAPGAPRGQRRRRRADGRSAVRRRVRLGGRLGEPRRCSSWTAGWAHRPTTHLRRARTGALPVYDWPAMARDDFSWIRARATRAGELFSLLRVDHALGFYRTYSRSPDGKVERLRARPTNGIRSSSARS